MAAQTLIWLVSTGPNAHWLQTILTAVAALGTLRLIGVDDAIAQVCGDTPALAIVDATTLGAAALPMVRQLHAAVPGLPIIVTTASPTWSRARQATLAGAVDYIAQSLDPALLTESLRRALERRHSAHVPITHRG